MVREIEKAEMVAAGVAFRAGLDVFISFNFYFVRQGFFNELATPAAVFSCPAIHLEFNF